MLLAFIVLTALGLVDHAQHTPLAALRRVHATEITADSAYRRWWTDATACLGLAAPYDAQLRYFVGETIPVEWGARQPKGMTVYFGFAKRDAHLILLARGFAQDSGVVVHEQLHAMLATDDHPARYFDGRCGVARDVEP